MAAKEQYPSLMTTLYPRVLATVPFGRHVLGFSKLLANNTPQPAINGEQRFS